MIAPVIEFLVLSVALAVVLVATARRGVAHLKSKWLLSTLMTLGWLAGIAVYAMPLTPVSRGLDAAAVMAGLVGLFAGRISYRIAQAWYLNNRDWEKTTPDNPPCLVHPIIAVGLFLSGVPVLYGWAAARHETLEFENTPRDAETGIVKGAEPLTLEPDTPGTHAVLMVHGYLATPNVFGDLPERLREAGFAVHAPLLPGHGTRPDDMALFGADEWREAVRTAWDEVEQRHEHVSVVGFSLGAALLMLESEGRSPERMVLVNPYLGTIGTPPWVPFETDSLVPVAARLTARVIRPDAFARLNKRENLPLLVTYRTVHLHSAVELQAIGTAMHELDPGSLPAPGLFLASTQDSAVPIAVVEAFFERARAGQPADELARFELSDHLLFLDHDAPAAVERALDWLGEPTPADE